MNESTHTVTALPPQDYAVLQFDHQEGSHLPSGGPYQLQGAAHVLVGELWVLAGQSNMEGVGLLSEADTPHPLVHLFDMTREQWRPATEPLHDLSGALRPAYTGGNPPTSTPDRVLGAGLGLAFAKARLAQTGKPVGLIPCARGGTKMSQWSPAGREDPQSSLYGAMLERIRLCGGKVTGVLWYQGESDACEEDWTAYAETMPHFIRSLRDDLGQPDLPFYMVQIGHYTVIPQPIWWQGWSAVREIQRSLPEHLPNVQVVAAIDLDLVDPIHVSARGLQRLGRRLARATQGQGGLQPASLTWQVSPLAAHPTEGQWKALHLEVQGVTGTLVAPGSPQGFSIRDQEGHDLHVIYHTVLQGNGITLLLDDRPLPDGAALWYGYGPTAPCNVTDSSDNALLCFGPMSLPQGP